MLEKRSIQQEQTMMLSRRDFLRLAGTVGISTILLWLIGCRPKNIIPPSTETPTPHPSGTPTPPEATPLPTHTTEPTTTPIPKEMEFAHLFPENTDLRKTVGPIDWTKSVTMIIPPDSNLLTDKEVSITFPNPLNVTEGSWDEMADKTNEFNEWWDREEKVMTFAGNPSAHPFVLLHAYQLKDGSRTYAGEYFRQALDREKSTDNNPLIGKSWIFQQEGDSGKVYQVKMSFVHMDELTADNFWNSMFVLDNNDKIITDYNHTWKPDPLDPSQHIPLIPEVYRQPQHITLATCDHGSAAIATLKIEEVKEITNP